MLLLTIAVALTTVSADPVPKKSAKDALQPLGVLIGSWKGTGYPDGKLNGGWSETVTWSWKFKGPEAWLEVAFDKGRYFTTGEMHYLPDTDKYRLSLTKTDKSKVEFTGSLELGKNKQPILTLDRTDAATKQDQRFVLSVLHANRYLFRYDTKPSAASDYAREYFVGATKDGEPFAVAPKGIECIVSGGRGTIAVNYKGKTYYVCCTGCRDAFNETPEKFILEAAKNEKK